MPWTHITAECGHTVRVSCGEPESVSDRVIRKCGWCEKEQHRNRSAAGKKAWENRLRHEAERLAAARQDVPFENQSGRDGSLGASSERFG